MFRLELPTDPRWAKAAEMETEEILTDHAWCEQKAASSAISLMVCYPEFPELVEKMAELAREEMEHFQRVHQWIQKKGYSLGRERKDPYVHALLAFQKKQGSKVEKLRDRLLLAALIEARSCERFRMLSESLSDKALAHFYRELMESEAGHYTLFISLARELTGREASDVRWAEWLAYEAEEIGKFNTGRGIHL